MLQNSESKHNSTKKCGVQKKYDLLTQTPRFPQTLLLLFSAKHEAKPSEFLNLIYIKILLEDTSVTACQTPRNCFPTPRKKLCGVSAKIQIPPLRSEMLAIIRDVISQ